MTQLLGYVLYEIHLCLCVVVWNKEIQECDDFVFCPGDGYRGEDLTEEEEREMGADDSNDLGGQRGRGGGEGRGGHSSSSGNRQRRRKNRKKSSRSSSRAENSHWNNGEYVHAKTALLLTVEILLELGLC